MKTPKEIGELLKEARSKKGLTIDEVYNKTRIQPKVIEALEDGRGSEVLGSVYTTLFLKKYASFLGLDGANLVEDHKGFHEEKEETALNIESLPKAASIDIDLQKWLVPAVYTALALIVMFFILSVGAKLKSPRKAPTETKTAVTAAPKPIVFPIPENVPIELALRSSEDVWMKIKKDGKSDFEGTLPKGEEKKWSASDNMELWVGRAEALNFTINGKSIGSIGRGNIKNIEISRHGLKIKNKWLLKAKN